jgi:glycosyltransferase involved in cell wall biosynthesis
MRVLALTNMYPPHHYGGYELSCRDVMARFRGRGHDVTVLTTTMRVAGVEDPVGEREEGVRRDLTFYWDDHVLLSPPLRRRLAIERANQRALAAALDDARPDVVSVWNMGALSLGLLTTLVKRDLPLVLNVCDEWPSYGPYLDAWTRLFRGHPLLGGVVARVARVPTAIPDVAAGAVTCFVSDAMRAKAIETSGWTFPDSTVVYSGIDRGDFPRQSGPVVDRSWRGRILYVGRLDDRKGIDTVVRALALLPDATLEIIGSGDAGYLASLHALIESLQVSSRVSFDVVPRADLAARYEAADVFVFPSTWAEPFGLVPVEAMACDTPVVATGTGGTGEFLANGRNALVFPPGDAPALASSIRRLADDPALRRRLVEAGRVTADELTVDRLADVLELWHLWAAGTPGVGRPAHRAPAATLLGARPPA